MPEIKDPKRLAAALDERLIRDDYRERAFTNGWRQFEQGLPLLIPCDLGPEARAFFRLGYGDAAGTPDPAPAVAPSPMDAREQRRFELAKAALGGMLASKADIRGTLDSMASDCVRSADAVLAALESDEKDGGAAA